MKLATMDIGSGTVRVLLCRLTDGKFHREGVKRRITRLADNFAGGLIQEAPLARTLEAAIEFAREARAFGAGEIRVACTGVTRRASNAPDFLRELGEKAGLNPLVIAGELEAKISAMGAAVEKGFSEQPFYLLDIGGFSTEIARIRGGVPEAVVSLEIGAVALADRHFKNDPPTEAELAACLAEVKGIMPQAAHLRAAEPVGPLVGTAGTITNLAAIDMRMERYDPARINQAFLTARRVGDLLNLLVSMPAANRLSLPGLEKGREDVIPAGAVICREVMEYLGIARLLVTEGGLLEGLAVQPEWPPKDGVLLTLE